MSEGMVNTEDYNRCSDEELVEISRGGDSAATDFLMEKYKGLVRKKAREFHIAGGDSDDLIQEGMLGLFKALRDYDASRGASFGTFANLCITRQLYTAVEAANRQKNLPLNSAGSTEDVLEKEPAPSDDNNPETQYISEESSRILEDDIRGVLSPFERDVLDLYLSGKNYKEIAADLGRDPKSTDNALQRIRTKVRNILSKGREF